MNLGNCDVCGRELQGYTSVNGMKFCAKCYQETFGQPTNNCLYCAFKSADKKMKTNSIKGFEKLKKENKVLKEALTIAINNILALQGITKDSPEYEYRFLATWNDYMEQKESK